MQKVRWLISSLFYADLLTFLTDLVCRFPLVFTGLEENVRKHSSSNLSRFNLIYNEKTTIVSTVVSERLNKKEQLVTKLTDESQSLKCDLNKAQASNHDLEKRVTELIDSLKK
jgi:predicted RNase H-like nuclease (RuvC/YqgF family)